MTIRDLTVKERILLHLFDYNRFAEEYEVPLEVTQTGIAKATSIRGTHVTQYVKPLMAEELLEVRVSHIRKIPRRRKVYFLTPRGRHGVASLRRTLLNEKVPFKTRAGKIVEIPLSRVYQEERPGSRLLALLGELDASGHIPEVLKEAEAEFVDFTEEAPSIEQLHGREQELQQVLRAMDEADLVVVTGIAGIGKTSLGSKICEEYRGRRSLFWRRVRSWDTAMSLASRLAQFLKALGRPRLYGLLNNPQETELSRVEDLLATELGGLDTVLIFDDVHTATEEAQAFFAMLLNALRPLEGVSTLLLSRTVPEFYSRREVELEGRVVEVLLKGLDEVSSRSLLAEVGVDETLAGQYVKASGGSPLFLKMLAKARQPSGRHPATLEAYIVEEIEPSLREAERRCMQAASLYEVPVPAEGLSLEVGSGTPTLISLERKGLLEHQETGNWIAHDLLRAYFRQGIPGEREAALVDMVVPWLQDEARRVAREGRPADAIPHLENAVLIEVDQSRLAVTLEHLGNLLEEVGDWKRATDAYRGASREAQETAAKARIMEKVADTLVMQGRLREAEREVEEGLELLPPTPTLEAAWLLRQRAIIAANRSDYDRTLKDLERVTGWMSGLPSDPLLQGSLAYLRAGIHRWHPDRLDLTLARVDYEEALSAFEGIGDVEWQALAHKGLARVAFETGGVKEALKHIDEAVALAQEIGHLTGPPYCLREKAYYLLECLGDFETAETLYREAYDLARQTEDQLLLIDFHVHFASLYWRQGRFEEAREALEYFLNEKAGLELNVAERIFEVTWMARLCGLCGDTESAEGYLGEAEKLARTHSSTEMGHTIAWARGLLHASLGNWAEAESSYRLALNGFPPPRAGMTTVDFLLDYGRFLATMGKGEEAKKLFLRALKESERLGREPLLRRTRRELELQAQTES